MLLPALNRARAMEKRSSCSGNVKRFSSALQMYADDNKGQGIHNKESSGNYPNVHDPTLLAGYLVPANLIPTASSQKRSSKVLACPGVDPSSTVYGDNHPPGQVVQIRLYSTYTGKVWQVRNIKDVFRLLTVPDALNLNSAIILVPETIAKKEGLKQ